MEINRRFSIALKYVSANGETTAREILATDFFDYDNYVESEWACDLPWRCTTLLQYLPVNVANVRSVTVSILDNATQQQRRVHVQYLEGTQLTLSWDDLKAEPGHFEIILDIPTGLDEATQIARLDVKDGDIFLGTHLLIQGDQATSLISKE